MGTIKCPQRVRERVKWGNIDGTLSLIMGFSKGSFNGCGIGLERYVMYCDC